MFYVPQSSRQQIASLLAIPMDEAAMSTRWAGIQHGDLANTVLTVLEEMGMKTANPMFFVKGDGNIFYGSVDVLATHGDVERCKDPMLVYSIGFRHSNCGRYALTFYVGARHSLTSAAMFHRELGLTKRHTINTVLRDEVELQMEDFVAATPEIVARWEWLEKHDVRDEQMALMIMKSVDYGLYPHRYGETVWSTWKDITKSKKHTTALDMYFATTEMIMDLQPHKQLKCLSNMDSTVKEVLAKNAK